MDSGERRMRSEMGSATPRISTAAITAPIRQPYATTTSETTGVRTAPPNRKAAVMMLMATVL